MDRTYTSDYVSNGRLAAEVTNPVFSKLKDHLAQVKRGEAVSPVQYMMQALENNEKQLNDHNAFVADTLESILSQQDLTKEQRRAMLMSVNENKLVVDPEHLDPILGAYEKANQALKLENSLLRRDLTSLSDTVDLLVADNSRLSEYLDRKNVDLISLLETISANEGELVQSLRANLNLLNEENRALNYEISMLKDLRAKDKTALLSVEEKILEDQKVNRKFLDDFSDVNLRNQSLENQVKLLELKIKNLNTEIEDERKKREAAEKKTLLPLKTCPICQGQGHQDTIIWQNKMNTIKEQERLQQENVYSNLEKEELKAVIAKLEESNRTKDNSIRDEKTKYSNLESEISKLKSEKTALNDNNLVLKKKIAELIEQEGLTSVIGRGNRDDINELVYSLDEENKRLKTLISELQNGRNVNLEQYERMNQDLIDQLRKEASALKDEKRNLLAKIKVLMERKTTSDVIINPGQTQEINVSMNENTNLENQGLRKHIEHLQAENRDLKRRLDEGTKRPTETGAYFGGADDFPDHISEPTPRRTTRGTGYRREREPSPIDDIVEKINQKDKSRGNTPEAVGRYLIEGDLNAQAGIYRKKTNAMIQNENRLLGYGGRAPALDTIKDPFDTISNDTARPRLSINQRFSDEPQSAIDMNANPRLMAHSSNQMPFYLNNKDEQVFVQQASRPVPDQSVSSNIQTIPSQISQGFIADQLPSNQGNLLSNFKLSGNVRRLN